MGDFLAVLTFFGAVVFILGIAAWLVGSIDHHRTLNRNLGGKHNDEWHIYHWWPRACQWKRRKERE